MRLGIFHHPIHDFKRGYDTLLWEDIEIIKAADELGYDEFWLGEHFGLPGEPWASPLLIFAYVLTQTKRIKLGAGVHCLPYYHPAQIGGIAAQFDHMAKGRYLMGIGPGATPPDFEMFGLLEKNRLEMMEESIDQILQFWNADPPYEFKGKHWSWKMTDNYLPDLGVGPLTKPYQKPHPPIMTPCMSRSSGAAKVAGRRGWMTISANFIPLDVQVQHYRDYAAAAVEAGHRPDPSKFRVARTLLVTETDEEAQAYMRRPNNALWWYFHYIIGLTSYGGFVSMLKIDPNMPDKDVTEEYCLNNIVIAGSPKTVAKKLAEVREKVCPFETLITSCHDWDDKKMWRRHLELLPQEVLPRLRSEVGWKAAAE